MTLKHKIVVCIFILIITPCYSQNNYVSLDHYNFVLKVKPNKIYPTFPQSRMIYFKGSYIGESFQMSFGRFNTVGFGLGLTTIDFEKQWLGIFPESKQFGAATLKGTIQNLSFPFSLTLITGTGPKGVDYARRTRFVFGITISYNPSFQLTNRFILSTHAAADSSSLLSTYNPSARELQHTLTLGLHTQVFLCDRHLRLAIEPYLGLGSRYFNVKGQSATYSYGLKIQLGIRLPKVMIERQRDRRNIEAQKQLLKQKQKEIEDQINKQP